MWRWRFVGGSACTIFLWVTKWGYLTLMWACGWVALGLFLLTRYAEIDASHYPCEALWYVSMQEDLAPFFLRFFILLATIPFAFFVADHVLPTVPADKE